MQNGADEILNAVAAYRASPQSPSPKVAIVDQTDLDPFHPSCLDDPYPRLRELQQSAPVAWRPDIGMWLVTRWDDAVTVLGDPAFGKEMLNGDTSGLENAGPLVALQNQWFLRHDPPSHGRLKQLASKALGGAMAKALQQQIPAWLDELLGAVGPTGHLDAIADLGAPLTFRMILALLGLSHLDVELFETWTSELVYLSDPHVLISQDSEVNALTTQLLDALKEQARDAQAPSLIHDLWVARDAGRLTDAELWATITLMLFGGTGTTRDLIGNGVVQLLRHPQQLALLRKEPAWLANAVEEITRMDTPLQVLHTRRQAGISSCGANKCGRETGCSCSLGLPIETRTGSVAPTPSTFSGSMCPILGTVPAGTPAPVHIWRGGRPARRCTQSYSGWTDSPWSRTGPIRRPTFSFRGYASVPLKFDPW